MSKRAPAAPADLGALIDLVEGIMIGIPTISVSDYHRTAERRRAALEQAADRLRDIGAVVVDTPAGAEIRLAGLRATSAMDLGNAAVNWLRQAARRTGGAS